MELARKVRFQILLVEQCHLGLREDLPQDCLV